MAQWQRKVPGTSDEVGAGPGGIEVGGRDVPVGTPRYDPKKALAAHGIKLTAKADLTVAELKQNGGELNPEQAGTRKRRPKMILKAYDPGIAEEQYGTVSSEDQPDILDGEPIGAMTDELAVRKVATVRFGSLTTSDDGPGEEAAGGGAGSAGAAGIGKSAPAQGDQSTPAVEGLTMPGFGYARLPRQKPLTEDQGKKSPKVIIGGAPPNATYPHAPIEPHAPLEKDETDDEPTTEWEEGRPQWMLSPGYGGKEPVYVSQKPDGNKDTLFAQNIMDDPPDVQPVDPDAYYIW